MGTDRILITDKSTFQMLASHEHLRRWIHFFENVTPVLVTEILGDLTWEMPAATITGRWGISRDTP